MKRLNFYAEEIKLLVDKDLMRPESTKIEYRCLTAEPGTRTIAKDLVVGSNPRSRYYGREVRVWVARQD